MYDVFISDLHLGNPFCKIELFQKFLKCIPNTSQLIIVGDCFDFWRTSDFSKYQNLLNFFKNKNIKIIPGNHDSELIHNPFPLQKYQILPTILDFQDIVITHGHIFDDTFGTSSKIFKFLDFLIFKMSLFLSIDLRTKFHFLTKFFYSNKASINSYITRKKPEVLIMGHTHTPEHLLIDNCQYFNLGSWFYKPHALVFTGEKYAFYEVTESFLFPQEKDFNDFW